mmetsp:Transcript_108769/g.307520  ORF Transcript_108769/g.307520 Transcript_108769/m.307520 type:complete len:319 (+) Transcript_108769:116-1072(+)
MRATRTSVLCSFVAVSNRRIPQLLHTLVNELVCDHLRHHPHNIVDLVLDPLDGLVLLLKLLHQGARQGLDELVVQELRDRLCLRGHVHGLVHKVLEQVDDGVVHEGSHGHLDHHVHLDNRGLDVLALGRLGDAPEADDVVDAVDDVLDLVVGEEAGVEALGRGHHDLRLRRLGLLRLGAAGEAAEGCWPCSVVGGFVDAVILYLGGRPVRRQLIPALPDPHGAVGEVDAVVFDVCLAFDNESGLVFGQSDEAFHFLPTEWTVDLSLLNHHLHMTPHCYEAAHALWRFTVLIFVIGPVDWSRRKPLAVQSLVGHPAAER